MTVGHILSQKGSAVVTAKPDDTVHAVELLTSRKVGAVVVLDGETIAGIVSERDIVRMIAERGEQALKLPVSEIMTRKLEVCLRHGARADEQDDGPAHPPPASGGRGQARRDRVDRRCGQAADRRGGI